MPSPAGAGRPLGLLAPASRTLREAAYLGTLVQRMITERQRWGVAAICIGVGQGLAVVAENLSPEGV